MTIKSIKIEDFLSIGHLSYVFEQGLQLFKGDNGAGKTSILQGLQVGLFNKAERSQPWGRIGGAGGFRIEINFTDVKGNDIVAINDRRRNRYEVYKNGNLETHQISKGLPMVSEMLNLTYHEFSMLSYLTPTTISSILTGTDTSLISKFFSLHVLKDYDTTLRNERKLLNRERKAIEITLADTVLNTKVYDIEKLKTSLNSLQIARESLKNSTMGSQINTLESSILTELAEVRSLEALMGHKVMERDKLTLSTGTCPTCGTNLSTNTTAMYKGLKSLEEVISSYNKGVQDGYSKVKMLETKLKPIKIEFDKEEVKLLDKITHINAELIAASVLETRDTVDIDKLNANISTLERKLLSLSAAILAISSGDVHKSYLQTFTSILNGNLGNLSRTLGIRFKVLAKIGINGLSFSVMDNGIYKFSDVLSSGERVIVGLMVLSAMFDTLGETLDIEISTIMLDEAIAAVSTENMQVVEELLKHLAESRCIIVTMHHEELPEDFFNSIKLIEKIDGLTNII